MDIKVFGYFIIFEIPTTLMYDSISRDEKRGYNPLKVENLVDLPPQTDPTDPLFQHQWYLKNTGQNGGKPKLDLNTAAAWAQGVTGKNVTTAIMDDGELFCKLLCTIITFTSNFRRCGLHAPRSHSQL